jgi:hypothetical protein
LPRRFDLSALSSCRLRMMPRGQWQDSTQSRLHLADLPQLPFKTDLLFIFTLTFFLAEHSSRETSGRSRERKG